MKTNLILIIIALATLFVSCKPKQNNKTELLSIQKQGLMLFVISDFGCNGYGLQRKVAETMGRLADSLSPSFIVSSGDQFHLNGVGSTSDPIWLSNFENIYTHMGLHVDWYPVLGNHEYHGNTQAVIDYSAISRRWCMPSRYYTKVKKVNDSTKLRLVFIDTPPFVEAYRKNPEKYPDAVKQDNQRQLFWIDSVLSKSTEKWKIVIGHHPVISIDGKHGNTNELILQLKPLLEKHNADFYFAGHIHNFQHIKLPTNNLDYIVTTSAAKPRPDSSNVLTRFSSPEAGFTVCALTADTFKMYFVNQDGKAIYLYQKAKLQQQ
jgi:predicted MPP superfamily phosphohydrolase